MKLILFMAAVALIIAPLANAEETATAAKTTTEVKDLTVETAPARVQSEYYFQAKKKKTAVTPSMDYNSQGGDFRYTPGGANDSGVTYNMSLERGISDKLAVALKVGYLNGSTELGRTTFDNDGLNDVRLSLKGRSLVSNNSEIMYGAHLIHSLEDKHQTVKIVPGVGKIPLSTEPQSGGSSVHAYVGYQKLLGSSVVGARLLQSAFGTERTTQVKIIGPPTFPSKSTLKEEGGAITELSLFYERTIKNFTLGSALMYRRRAKIEQTEPTAVTTSSAMQFLGVELNPTLHVKGLNLDVLGQVRYRTLLEANTIYQGQRLSDAEIVDVSLGARYLF